MCGRYAFIPDKDFYDRFEITNRGVELTTSYNCTPGQELPVIVKNSPKRIVFMHWGMKPGWVKEVAGKELINARSEGIADKPTFKKALLQNRCLVPVSGFYEWQKTDGKSVPYYFGQKSRGNFCLAGIYDEGGFVIITTRANKLMQPIHDRMPAILDKNSEELWLESQVDIENLLKLLNPAPENELRYE